MPEHQDSPGGSLLHLFDGWNGYQHSLVQAIQPLTAEQLAWQPAPHLQSVGEIARHISLGRLTWFLRMDAPESAEIASMLSHWEQDRDGNPQIVESAVPITTDPRALVQWLERTWSMVASTLRDWSPADLSSTYRHTWNGKVYAVSRQWTIWRILSHDIHHGGEISLMLGMQGIEAFELSGLFGHIVLPPLADDASATLLSTS